MRLRLSINRSRISRNRTTGKDSSSSESSRRLFPTVSDSSLSTSVAADVRAVESLVAVMVPQAVIHSITLKLDRLSISRTKRVGLPEQPNLAIRQIRLLQVLQVRKFTLGVVSRRYRIPQEATLLLPRLVSRLHRRRRLPKLLHRRRMLQRVLVEASLPRSRRTAIKILRNLVYKH